MTSSFNGVPIPVDDCTNKQSINKQSTADPRSIRDCQGSALPGFTAISVRARLGNRTSVRQGAASGQVRVRSGAVRPRPVQES